MEDKINKASQCVNEINPMKKFQDGINPVGVQKKDRFVGEDKFDHIS